MKKIEIWNPFLQSLVIPEMITNWRDRVKDWGRSHSKQIGLRVNDFFFLSKNFLKVWIEQWCQRIMLRSVRSRRCIGFRRAFALKHEVVGSTSVSLTAAATVKKKLTVDPDARYLEQLWNTFHRPKLLRENMETCLKDLGLAYVDHVQLHYPFAMVPPGDER